jgi:hypothetical protein
MFLPKKKSLHIKDQFLALFKEVIYVNTGKHTKRMNISCSPNAELLYCKTI